MDAPNPLQPSAPSETSLGPKSPPNTNISKATNSAMPPDQAQPDLTTQIHAEEDEFMADANLAAQMGFSAFGGSTKDGGPAKKKRKHGHSGFTFTDVSVFNDPPGLRAEGTGGNALPLGKGRKGRMQANGSGDAGGDGGTGKKDGKEDGLVQREERGMPGVKRGQQSTISSEPPPPGVTVEQQQPPDLAAYRNGVTLSNGAIAYFLPSFIEDPWARLKTTAGKAVGG